MPTTLRMEDTARQWLHDEAKRRAAAQTTDFETPRLLLSPASWVLPKLLRIVYQNADQPVESLGPLIHKMLEEQVFATTGGDPCEHEWLASSINESVGVLVEVLKRVRAHGEVEKQTA